jgi:hypothetical protein
MEVLENGVIAPESAFETVILGRLAARGANDGTERFILKHPSYKDQTTDEVEYLHREWDVGRLVLDRHMSRLAEVGMDEIIQTNTKFNMVSPKIAKLFRNAFDKAWEEQQLSEAGLLYVQPAVADVQPAAETIAA